MLRHIVLTWSDVHVICSDKCQSSVIQNLSVSMYIAHYIVNIHTVCTYVYVISLINKINCAYI